MAVNLQVYFRNSFYKFICCAFPIDLFFLGEYWRTPFMTKIKLNIGSGKWVGVRGFSKVVATFNHVGWSFNHFMATTGCVWIIPSFWIWGYVLFVEHISCVITNCDQHQWVIPSLSIALEALLEENINRKLLFLYISVRFVLQNLTIPCYFPYIIFYRYLFSNGKST